MLITKRSEVSGAIRTLDLPVTMAQMQAWMNGELIQNAMPQLTDDQREFILTGITPEEWNKIFPPDEDEADEPAF